MKRRLFLFLFLVSLLTVAGTNALADSFTLYPCGLGDNEDVLSYYDNGTGSGGSGSGLDYGITFDPSFLAIEDVGPYGYPCQVGLLGGPSSTMNVSGGFTDVFSFYYKSYNPGLVTLWSGLDGTGVMLGDIPLSLSPPPRMISGMRRAPISMALPCLWSIAGRRARSDSLQSPTKGW